MFRNLHFGFKFAGLCAAALVASTFTACGSDNKDNGATTGTGSVAAGQTAATKYLCTTCHGSDFSGSTTSLTGATMATGIGSWDAATIVNAILNGKDDDNATLCAPMPVFSMNAPPMTMQEATDIAAYLKSLPAVSKTIPESMCAAKGGT